MGSMAEAQRHTFNARIKRIHKGGPTTMGHILVGSQDSSTGKPSKPIKVRKGLSFFGRLRQALLHIFLMPVSFLLGGAAMLLGMALVYHFELIGLLEADAEGLLAHADVAAALIVAVGLGGALRLSKGPRKLALFLGIAAVFVLEPQLRTHYPEPFAVLMPESSPIVAALENLTGT